MQTVIQLSHVKLQYYFLYSLRLENLKWLIYTLHINFHNQTAPVAFTRCNFSIHVNSALIYHLHSSLPVLPPLPHLQSIYLKDFLKQSQQTSLLSKCILEYLAVNSSQWQRKTFVCCPARRLSLHLHGRF